MRASLVAAAVAKSIDRVDNCVIDRGLGTEPKHPWVWASASPGNQSIPSLLGRQDDPPFGCRASETQLSAWSFSRRANAFEATS